PHVDKWIPIIGDEHVDFEFGTGVLKVTPAHDKADFDIGQRHNLAAIEVIDPDGSMNKFAGGDLSGLDRFEARKLATKKLEQLWWGHQIPVWYHGEEVKCQVDSPGPDWKQDPDVLDTWCSSWLWPFATMDEQTKKKFYPTTVLVTAPEILFFWVARMIMAGYE